MSKQSITQKMRGRPVTHEDAMKSAHRLVNSHFHNKDSARCSIPVQAYDDDVVIIDYISEQSALPPIEKGEQSASEARRLECIHCSGQIEKRQRGSQMAWIHVADNRYWCEGGHAEPLVEARREEKPTVIHPEKKLQQIFFCGAGLQPSLGDMPEPMVGAWDIIDAISKGEEQSRFIAAELQQWRKFGAAYNAAKGVK